MSGKRSPKRITSSARSAAMGCSLRVLHAATAQQRIASAAGIMNRAFLVMYTICISAGSLFVLGCLDFVVKFHLCWLLRYNEHYAPWIEDIIKAAHVADSRERIEDVCVPH